MLVQIRYLISTQGVQNVLCAARNSRSHLQNCKTHVEETELTVNSLWKFRYRWFSKRFTAHLAEMCARHMLSTPIPARFAVLCCTAWILGASTSLHRAYLRPSNLFCSLFNHLVLT
jgi:hypothetical protein